MSYIEHNPETVRFRSARLAYDGFGFSVQIRELLGAGGGSTGRRGIGVFCFSYRPRLSERRSAISFEQDPEHLLTPEQNRIALLLPPDRPFAWSWENGLGRIATFCFTPRFSEAVLARAGLPIRPLYGFPPPSFAINYQVEGLCRLLMEETELGCPKGRTYFEHLGAALLIAVASQTDPCLPGMGDLEAQHRRLQPAIALIKKNFGSKLTLAQLAKATDLSLFHFSRLFRAAVGMAPCQYLWAYRLYRARLLLSAAGPGQSIGQVSAECGFADQTHLSRRFRQAYGHNPLAFRQAQQKGASRVKKSASAS